jgi:hypothetical protein
MKNCWEESLTKPERNIERTGQQAATNIVGQLHVVRQTNGKILYDRIMASAQ